MLVLFLALVLLARGSSVAASLSSSAQSQSETRPGAPDPSVADAIERAREHVTRAHSAHARAEYDSARAQAALAKELLLAIPVGDVSDAGCDLLRALAELSIDLGQLRSVRDCLERAVLELATRHSDDDPRLSAARLELAYARYYNADFPAAVELVERVLQVYERTLPEADPLRLRARSLHALVIGRLGRWAEARELQVALVDVRSTARPADRVGLAGERVNLAVSHTSLGELSQARQLLEQALEIFEQELSRDHRDLRYARASLQYVLARMGELQAARRLLEQVVESYVRVLDENDPRVRWGFTSLGKLLSDLAENSAARESYARALAIAERTLPAEHEDVLSLRADFAWQQFALGELEAARESSEAVLEVAARALPDAHPIALRTRRSLAAVLNALGEQAAAREICERALVIAESALPPGHQDIVLAREALANTLSRMGDLAGARVQLEQVLEARERAVPPHTINIAVARMNLAVILEHTGDLAAARALHERALADFLRVLTEDHRHVQETRLNLAVVLEKSGDLAGAREHYEAVLAHRERTLPPDHPELARVRTYLASVLSRSGDFEAARDLLGRALEVLARTRPDTDLLLMVGRISRARLLARLAARSDTHAADCASEAAELVIAVLRGARASTWTTLFDGSPREVEERVAFLDERVELALSGALGRGVFPPDDAALREAFLYFESSRASGSSAVRLAARLEGDDVGADLHARVASATRELADRAASGADPESLDAARADLDRAGRELVRYVGRALGAESLVEPTIETLAAALGPRDALVAWRRMTIQTVERGPEARERQVRSYVAFVLRPSDPSVEAVPEARAPRFTCVDLGPAEPIEQAADSWRSTLTGSAGGRGVAVASSEDARAGDDRTAANRLRELVLDPLRDRLVGVERLIVALEDVLHTIPLEALPADGPWSVAPGAPAPPRALLGDALRIEVRSSLLEILQPPSSPRADPLLLALGGADFDHHRASAERPAGSADERVDLPRRPSEGAGVLRGGAWEAGFAPLPGTLAEARGIARTFQDVFGRDASQLVLEGPGASTPALREGAHGARWLHLATHGWFAPESVRSRADPELVAEDDARWLRQDVGARVRSMSPMLLCGLALAGANLPAGPDGRIAGLVTAQELATLDLSSCELAVLSACDTNVGIRRAGQGVASLQRALHMAGARSVITSLWKVPDETTKELMLDFYRRMWVEKKPKWQALKEAKRKLRDAKDEHGDPKYGLRDWAAWVLTGEPD